MNPLAAIGTAAGSMKTAAQGVETFLEMARKWRAWRISDITTLKMLYLELDRLLELTELLLNKGFLKKAADRGSLFTLLREIDLTVTGLVLAREDKYSVFRKIMKRGPIGADRKAPRDYENVLQALSFIYTKTAALKALAGTADRELFREIRAAERLENIAESVNLVLKVLVTFKEVNVIARRWHRTE